MSNFKIQCVEQLIDTNRQMMEIFKDTKKAYEQQEKEEFEDCKHCKYFEVETDAEPCNVCSKNYFSQFKKQEEQKSEERFEINDVVESPSGTVGVVILANYENNLPIVKTMNESGIYNYIGYEVKELQKIGSLIDENISKAINAVKGLSNREGVFSNAEIK